MHWQSVKHWPRALARAGHQPGALLQRLRADLGSFDCSLSAPEAASFRTPDDQVEFVVREVLETQFLMHLTSAEFVCTKALSAAHPLAGGTASVKARHDGMLRRSGVSYSAVGPSSGATAVLLAALEGCAVLSAALMPLDFTGCRFDLNEGRAAMTVRHFAACELVGRLPKFRRYIRLEATQRDALVEGFRAFRLLMQG